MGSQASENIERRGRCRHTRVCAPAVVMARTHQRAKEAAAGDQNIKSQKPRQAEVLLPLKAPSDEDSYVQYNTTERSRGRYQPHESGLRMPLFDGGDWAGFMSQFEACINYYGWTEKTKTIRLYTSIVGAARKTLGAVNTSTWTYAQLKKHMEVRYGKSKVYAQIQSELLSRTRKPGQALHEYYDELVATSYTANIPEVKRVELIHTAFVFGLRGNQHMHRWVTKREEEATIEAALEAAELYEDEYGSEPVLQSRPVTVNARDTTGNTMAVALLGNEATDRAMNTVSVDAVSAEAVDSTAPTTFTNEFKQLRSFITQKFETLDSRLGGVEQWQTNQVKRWKENAEKRKKFRDGNRAKNYNNKNGNSNGQSQGYNGPRQNGNNDGGRNDHQSSKNNKQSSEPEVNTRDTQNRVAGDE